MSAANAVPDIYSAFSNKHLFVTGGSGFLGKVLLHKLLKEFPDVASITLLMRAKKGKKPMERIDSEVLSSACFDGLKEQLGEAEWKKRTGKLRVAVGDVLLEQLGLCAEDMQWLAAHVNIILHLAATVNFQEKLNISLQMNTLGGLRVLSLAKKCANIEAMVHTSTCYVNYPRHGGGLVREKIYDLPFDAEQMTRHILGIPESDIPRQTKVLLEKFGFPNTYCFTKNMGEVLLQKMKGSVPLSIVRPAIVGCALREPYPGWVDVLTAAGGLIFTVGLGVVHEMHADPSLMADIVPVDYVVNTLIKVAYKTAVNHKLSKMGPMIESSAAAAAATSANNNNNNNNKFISTTASPASSPAAAGKNAVVKAAPAPQNSNDNSGSGGILNLDSLRISTYAESSNSIIRPANGSKAVAANNGAGGPPTVLVAPASNASSASDDSGVNGMPFVFQSATSSSMNPLTWGMTKDTVVSYFRRFPAPRQVDTPWVRLIPNGHLFNAVFFVTRRVPFAAMQTASALNLLTPKQKELVQKYEKMMFRVMDMAFQFKPFTTVEWKYDYKHNGKLEEGMDPKCRAAFGTDLCDINMRTYIEAYCYGLVRYFMKVKDARPAPPAPGSAGERFLQSML